MQKHPSQEISSDATSLDAVSISGTFADNKRILEDKYPEQVHRFFLEPVHSKVKANIKQRCIYTVIDRRITQIADAIMIRLEGSYFKKMPWQSLGDGEDNDISCLIVFQQGTSGSCRGEDILTSLRERLPAVETIVAVCICIDNDEEHSTKCLSVSPFVLDTDILFEYHIFTKSGPHKCSTGICIDIESHIRKILESPDNRETEDKESVTSTITKEQSPSKRTLDMQDDISKKNLYHTTS